MVDTFRNYIYLLNKAVKVSQTSKFKDGIRPRSSKDGPPGGILFSEACERYNIPKSTLFDWISYGWVTVIQQKGKFKFVNEVEVAKMATLERHAGKRTIEKLVDNGR